MNSNYGEGTMPAGKWRIGTTFRVKSGGLDQVEGLPISRRFGAYLIHVDPHPNLVPSRNGFHIHGNWVHNLSRAEHGWRYDDITGRYEMFWYYSDGCIGTPPGGLGAVRDAARQSAHVGRLLGRVGLAGPAARACLGSFTVDSGIPPVGEGIPGQIAHGPVSTRIVANVHFTGFPGVDKHSTNRKDMDRMTKILRSATLGVILAALATAISPECPLRAQGGKASDPWHVLRGCVLSSVVWSPKGDCIAFTAGSYKNYSDDGLLCASIWTLKVRSGGSSPKLRRLATRTGKQGIPASLFLVGQQPHRLGSRALPGVDA